MALVYIGQLVDIVARVQLDAGQRAKGGADDLLEVVIHQERVGLFGLGGNLESLEEFAADGLLGG